MAKSAAKKKSTKHESEEDVGLYESVDVLDSEAEEEDEGEETENSSSSEDEEVTPPPKARKQSAIKKSKAVATPAPVKRVRKRKPPVQSEDEDEEATTHADLEMVDVSIQKPNITRKMYNLGDNFKMYVAPHTVTNGKTASTFSYEALHIKRDGGVDANGKKKKDFVTNYNIKLLVPMLDAMNDIYDSMQESVQDNRKSAAVRPVKKTKLG